VKSVTAAASPAIWLAGTIADLPTPFDDDGGIDLVALARLCERQIEAGASAIVVGETAGEAATLTPAEHDRIVRAAVQTARGRVRVIAGAGSNSTRQAVELTGHAEAAGASAVLSVVPYYNKPMQAGIYAHFRAVADSTSLPVILHDIPSRTIRELSDETLARLAESRQFIGLRDATCDMARPLRLRPLVPTGFRLLSGDDATALGFVNDIERRAGIVPGYFLKLPAGTVAVREISATSDGAADSRTCQREPCRPEICLEPAGLDAPHHPPADR